MTDEELVIGIILVVGGWVLGWFSAWIAIYWNES